MVYVFGSKFHRFLTFCGVNVTERLVDRELAAARQSLATLRAEIRRAPGLSLFDKLADHLISGPKMKSRAELAAPYLAEIEQIHSRITASLHCPVDFKGIEQAIDNLNHEILAGIAEVSQANNALESFGDNEALQALVFLARLSDSDNPLGLERLEALRGRFHALKVYKQVLDSERLQNKRVEMLPDFLRQAQKWDSVACKIEIRKRRDQLAKIEVDPLPKVNLLTALDVPLPQIFVRQQRFLSDIISDLEEIRQKGGGGTEQSKNRREEVNGLIKECEQEIKKLQSDTSMDENSRRRRLNILSRKLDSLYEELESLY